MKKLTLSIAAVMAMSTLAIAGGDIKEIEPAVTPVMEVAVVDDSGFYLGIAYGMANVTEDYEKDFYDPDLQWNISGTYEEDHNAIMLQAGYKLNKYFAVEGRYWKSTGDSDWSDKGTLDSSMTDNPVPIDNSGTDAELTAWGLYVKPMYPVTEAFDIYALLGYGNVILGDDVGDWLDESGFQWGLGASYEFTNNLSVFADYVELYNDGDSVDKPIPGYGLSESWDDTIYTINFGVTYKF